MADVFSSPRNPLKFTVDEVTSIQLYAETDEPVNILNIKRGIVSALMVPVMEDDENSLMVSSDNPNVSCSQVLSWERDVNLNETA